MSLKRVKDIEVALTWAVRDELPKCGDQGRGGYSPDYPSSHPMWRGAALGGRVDNWTREPGFPAAMGEPHPDALLIQEALRSLEAAPLDLGRLRIDEGLEGFALNAAAIGAVAQGQVLATVIAMASLGKRPASGDLIPQCAAQRAANGQILVWRRVTQHYSDGFGGTIPMTHEETVPAKSRRGGLYQTGSFTKLAWEPGPQEVISGRAEYAAWWLALEHLADTLDGSLETLRITGPVAPARPWARDPSPPPAAVQPRPLGSKTAAIAAAA